MLEDATNLKVNLPLKSILTGSDCWLDTIVKLSKVLLAGQRLGWTG